MSKDEQSTMWSGLDYVATREHDVTNTDMGLYLARNIIEQHGGRIWIDSTEGNGTTVFVGLPKTAAAGAVMAMPPQAELTTSPQVDAASNKNESR
jgi:K+-sensing histidine kinase KdpD